MRVFCAVDETALFVYKLFNFHFCDIFSERLHIPFEIVCKQRLQREQQRYGMSLIMITHDLKEGFYLGTRLWVFDKTRLDAQNPNAFGACITYDIPVDTTDRNTYKTIDHSLDESKKLIAEPE